MNSLKGMMSVGIWNGLMAYIVLKRLKIMHIVITTKNQIIHNKMSISLHIMFFSNRFKLIGLAVALGLSRYNLCARQPHDGLLENYGKTATTRQEP